MGNNPKFAQTNWVRDQEVGSRKRITWYCNVAADMRLIFRWTAHFVAQPIAANIVYSSPERCKLQCFHEALRWIRWIFCFFLKVDTLARSVDDSLNLRNHISTSVPWGSRIRWKEKIDWVMIDFLFCIFAAGFMAGVATMTIWSRFGQHPVPKPLQSVKVPEALYFTPKGQCFHLRSNCLKKESSLMSRKLCLHCLKEYAEKITLE